MMKYRIFTTMQEVRDPILLTGFVLATVLNGVLALQMALYWNNSGKKGGKKNHAITRSGSGRGSGGTASAKKAATSKSGSSGRASPSSTPSLRRSKRE
jgi:hypothetical protein